MLTSHIELFLYFFFQCYHISHKYNYDHKIFMPATFLLIYDASLYHFCWFIIFSVAFYYFFLFHMSLFWRSLLFIDFFLSNWKKKLCFEVVFWILHYRVLDFNPVRESLSVVGSIESLLSYSYSFPFLPSFFFTFLISSFLYFLI